MKRWTHGRSGARRLAAAAGPAQAVADAPPSTPDSAPPSQDAAEPFYRQYLVAGQSRSTTRSSSRSTASRPLRTTRTCATISATCSPCAAFRKRPPSSTRSRCKLDRRTSSRPTTSASLRETEGKLSEAISAYQKSIKRKPGFPQSRFRLGRVVRAHEPAATRRRGVRRGDVDRPGHPRRQAQPARHRFRADLPGLARQLPARHGGRVDGRRARLLRQRPLPQAPGRPRDLLQGGRAATSRTTEPAAPQRRAAPARPTGAGTAASPSRRRAAAARPRRRTTESCSRAPRGARGTAIRRGPPKTRVRAQRPARPAPAPGRRRRRRDTVEPPPEASPRRPRPNPRRSPRRRRARARKSSRRSVGGVALLEARPLDVERRRTRPGRATGRTAGPSTGRRCGAAAPTRGRPRARPGDGPLGAPGDDRDAGELDLVAVGVRDRRAAGAVSADAKRPFVTAASRSAGAEGVFALEEETPRSEARRQAKRRAHAVAGRGRPGAPCRGEIVEPSDQLALLDEEHAPRSERPRRRRPRRARRRRRCGRSGRPPSSAARPSAAACSPEKSGAIAASSAAPTAGSSSHWPLEKGAGRSDRGSVAASESRRASVSISGSGVPAERHADLARPARPPAGHADARRRRGRGAPARRRGRPR